MILIGVLDSGRRAGPGVPNIGTATDVGTARAFNNGAATVTFTQGSGVTPTSYTVKAYNSAGVYQNISATGASSPITVTGLLSNTNYKFTVFATAGTNSSAESAFSNAPLITTVPQAPTIGTATAGNASATVGFTGNATGGKTISTYTATSSPSSITGSSATTPITVSGLSNGTPYTFTVTATNANGTSIASAASNSVTPTAPQYVITGTALTPFVNAYPWTNGTGFGSRYANPVTLPASAIQSAAQANGNTVAFAEFNSPRIGVYPWSASGFGTRYANPTVIPTAPSTDVSFTSNGNSIAISIQTTATLVAWPWSGSGFGTQYAAPAYVPTGNSGNGITFNPSNNVILNTNNDSTQYVSAWAWNPGFGTKFANPSTIAQAGSRRPKFNSAGTVVTWNNGFNTTLDAYVWSSGFGSKYAQPATVPASGGNGTAWNANSVVAYATQNASSPMAVYNFSGGYGTRFTNPTAPTSNAGGAATAFTSDGNTFLVGTVNTSLANVTVHAYAWSNSTGFGTKYADPAGYSAAAGNNTKGIVCI